MRPHMSNMEELVNQILIGTTKVQNELSWLSKSDLEYTNGQLELSEETSRCCNFELPGRKMKRNYRF